MKIRSSEISDIDKILKIYEKARCFMAETGNPNQWKTTYPSREQVECDINSGKSYVVTDEGDIAAVFYFSAGPDPTYSEIYDGEWPDNEPYAVIHRIAVADKGKGIVAFVFDYCSSHADRLRIDTHRDNIPMQRALLKYGFKHCGIIHISDGSERLAYQKNNTRI